MNEFELRAAELIDAGRQLYNKGMVPATSGNFSARLSDGSLVITVSGAHKGKLTLQDIMQVDADGVSLDGKKPSAETLLHTGIYQQVENAGVVLHPHSVNATVLSMLSAGSLILQDYELLKAFPGIDTHDCKVCVPVLDNNQDISVLAQQVQPFFAQPEGLHGYLIRGHGFYTWGQNIDDALRHVEAFEFLFDCELTKMKAG
ncbi:MAG: methylthioribulose 1-phosphate dehydratase [Gammaproteobacteria bacterium]|nr:methylthioribulose 1-phosphate dehydratase [Gammaproteobacteria bacterium]